MVKDPARGVQVVEPDTWSEKRIVTFALAIGSVRLVCQLKTEFRTRNEALSYLHKRRTIYEKIARERFARGEIENGIIHLTMV